MILILTRFRGGGSRGIFGGGQSRDIFRGGPVKKITLYNQLWFCSVFCLNIERSASRFKRQAPKPSKSNRVKQALLQTLMYIIQPSALLHLRIFLSFSEGILHPDQNYLARNMYVICKPWSHNRLFSQNDRILTIIILVNFSNPILVLPCSANTGRPINTSEVNLP